MLVEKKGPVYTENNDVFCKGLRDIWISVTYIEFKHLYTKAV